MLLEDDRAGREVLLRVLHHVHLQIRFVGCSIRAEGARMHRLLAALVHHVPPQVLHLVVTAVAPVAGEATLTATSPVVRHRARQAVAHLHVICNHE